MVIALIVTRAHQTTGADPPIRTFVISLKWGLHAVYTDIHNSSAIVLSTFDLCHIVRIRNVHITAPAHVVARVSTAGLTRRFIATLLTTTLRMAPIEAGDTRVAAWACPAGGELFDSPTDVIRICINHDTASYCRTCIVRQGLVSCSIWSTAPTAQLRQAVACESAGTSPAWPCGPRATLPPRSPPLQR